MRLIVVRHGETVENASDIVMGHHGGTLSDKGIAQAQAAAIKIKDENFEQAYSSDLKRCVDTAKIILNYHPRINLRTTPALREVNYSEFQGRPAAEIRAFFDRVGFDSDTKAPGGESHREMGARVIKFVNELLQHNGEKEILLISHNGPIEALRAAIERTPFTKDSENAGIKYFEIHNSLKQYEG